MRMQEPEQWQPSGQEWQTKGYGEQRADYPGRYEPEQQKIYPQGAQSLHSNALWIIVMVLSSIGFGLTVAGVVASAIVLKYANGQQMLLAGGVIGLISSIVVMLLCVAIFVITIVTLAARIRGRRRWTKQTL
jgi:hypothetical protein